MHISQPLSHFIAHFFNFQYFTKKNLQLFNRFRKMEDIGKLQIELIQNHN